MDDVNEKLFLESLQLCYLAYKQLNLYVLNESQVQALNKKVGILESDLKVHLSNEEELCYTQLYAVFFELNYMHFTLEKIIKCLDLSNYDKAYTEIQELEEKIKLLFSWLSNIELYIKNSYLKFNVFISSLPINFFKTLKRTIILLKNNKYSEYQDAFIRLDISILNNKLNVIKFLYPLYFIIVLPSYDDEFKKYSIRLLTDMNKILGKSSLQYIQLQKMKFDKDKSISLRGVSAGTTRVLGIFTRDNDDIYLFRIDFPHHAEESIHINLHETRNNKNLEDAYYPLSYEEKKTCPILPSIFDKITFDYRDGYYWFKSKSKNLVSTMKGVSQEKKDEAIAYLENRHHFEIENSSKEDTYMNFINHYISFFGFLDMQFIKQESFGRENTENAVLMKTIREEINTRIAIYAMYYLKCGIPETEIINELQISSELLERIKENII